MAVAYEEPAVAEIELRVRDEGITIETDLYGNAVRELPPLSRAGPANPPCDHCLVSSPVLVNRLLRSDPERIGNARGLELPSYPL
jgi:hypothetical protein